MKVFVLAALAALAVSCGSSQSKEEAAPATATVVSPELAASAAEGTAAFQQFFGTGWLFAGTLVHSGTLSNPSIAFQARNLRQIGFEVSSLCAPKFQAGAVRVYDGWHGGFLQPITFVTQQQQGLVIRAVYQVQGLPSVIADGLTATLVRQFPSQCALRVYTRL